MTGIDTGGTFTDLVAVDEDAGDIRLAKVLSTPDRPQDALFDALAAAGVEPADVASLAHGTTVATNILLERTGAPVALFATAGFRDLLFLQRGSRPHPYDLDWRKPDPVVPRRRCFDIPERLTADGAEELPLAELAVRSAVRLLRAQGEVEAIAVAYLYSYIDPAHERRTGEIIEEEWPGVHVSLSSDVLPRWREYERTSTTVIDAWLKPKLDAYMRGLADRCAAQRIRRVSILRSNGGVMTVRRAARRPVTLVRSGPAGGIVACQMLGAALGLGDLVAADMGGTSFEAALLTGGEPPLTTAEELDWGVPIAVPMLDVRSIGSGGGSLLDIDRAGLLQVGPASAGSTPGPACYGRGGTRATVTDANLALGRLSERFLLGGTQRVSRALAEQAIAPLAKRLDMSVSEVARGALQVCNSHMAQALRLVSTDRGYDPRRATLVAYGGAGPLHACELARALRIRTVVVPPNPGAFSALGALLAEVRLDYATTRIIDLDESAAEAIEELRARLRAEASQELAQEDDGASAAVLAFEVDARYLGQNWELSLPLPAPGPALVEDLRRAFDAEHRHRYGFDLPHEHVELTAVKLTARLARSALRLPAWTGADEPDLAPATDGVHFDGFGVVDTVVMRRSRLRPGSTVPAPALLGQLDATVVIPPDVRATVHDTGAIVIEIPDRSEAAGGR